MRRRIALATAAATFLSPLLLSGTAQASTPVAVWHMEDAINHVMTDSSGSNNDGTTSSGISIVSGYSGAGYRFASNGFVTVPDSATLNPGSEDFSFSIYVNFPKAPPAGGDFDVIRKGLATTSGGEWKMEIFGNSTLSSPAFCLFKGSTATSAVTVRGTTNLAGAWHKITCTKTSTQVTVAVDDVVQRTNKTAVGSISNTADVSIGRKLGGGDQYIGDMDEVTITKGPVVPADTTSPTATVAPADGLTGVGGTANVTATFSETVQGVDLTTFTLTDPSGVVVPGTVTNPTGNKWVLNPTGTLAAGTVYTATLVGGSGPTGIRDLANNPLSPNPKTWTFTTA